MIITDIQPRRHRLSQLFLDGEAAMKVDTETWLRSGLAKGDEIDDERLYQLLQDSAAHRAHEKALYLLEHRAHSKKELADKPISPDLESAIANRQTVAINRAGGGKIVAVTSEEDITGYTAQVVSPIIAASFPLCSRCCSSIQNSPSSKNKYFKAPEASLSSFSWCLCSTHHAFTLGVTL